MPLRLTIPEPNPSGLCMCGCGQPAPVAVYGNSRRGWVAGRPVRYITGHNSARLPDEALLRKYVVTETGCWLWTGCRDANGYGVVRGTKKTYAHRFFFEASNGPIADGLELDHLCGNRACCNPNHLEPVPHAINVRRGRAALLDSEKAQMIRVLAAPPHSLAPLDIAKQFGVSRSCIYNVLLGRAWRSAAIAGV